MKTRKPLSEQHKKSISEKLKKAHSEGKHPGWLNSNRKHKSYPERLFESTANDKGLFSKYDIIDQFPFHGYFFDFAIIDCKVDLEIDGVQHYRTQESIDYDNKRDSFVMAKGWKVYRISAKELKDDPEKELNLLLEFLNSESSYRIYSREDLKEYFNKDKRLYGNRKAYMEAKKKKWEDANLKYVDMIKSSNIDFTKFGWVSEVSKIISQKPQKVNSWMKRMMPEFFEKNCFKRR